MLHFLSGKTTVAAITYRPLTLAIYGLLATGKGFRCVSFPRHVIIAFLSSTY